MSLSNFYYLSLGGDFEHAVSLQDALAALKNGGFIWLEYYEPTREELNPLVESLGIHPLAIEDCTDDDQVPKVEDYPNHSFILFNGFEYKRNMLLVHEVDMLVGDRFLVTVGRCDEQGQPYLKKLSQVLQRNVETCRQGPAYAAYTLLDYVVDQKFTAIEKLEDELNAAEDNILGEIKKFDPATLLDLRRDLLAVRKSLFHEREILVRINRGDCRYIPSKTLIYFRDIYDHLAKFFELTESYRDIETSLMEIYLSMINNQMAKFANDTNITVRRLTFITTIFMPLTLLAGIGGMSEYSMMTGAENWPISYSLFLVGMVVIGVISYFLLRAIEHKGGR
jgi:magnesium transporter